MSKLSQPLATILLKTLPAICQEATAAKDIGTAINVSMEEDAGNKIVVAGW